jgi:hypothetical protein
MPGFASTSKYLATLYSVLYCRVLGIHMLGHIYQVTDEACKKAVADVQTRNMCSELPVVFYAPWETICMTFIL